MVGAARERVLYTFSEVDRLAAVSSGTAKRWLLGYTYVRDGKRITVPPITPRKSQMNGATFYDLIEVVAIGKFREQGFTLQAIRRIVDACQKILGVPRPLTTLVFKNEGYRLFVESPEGELVEVLRTPGQMAWRTILEPFLENLDYRANRVAAWWPQGRSAGILVDPEFGWGRPVIAGKGVRTDIILEHLQAGESISDIARDFELTPTEVEAALRFELSRQKIA